MGKQKNEEPQTVKCLWLFYVLKRSYIFIKEVFKLLFSKKRINHFKEDKNAGEEDFKDGTHSQDFNYIYDVNGNMVKDLNKNMGNIEYNHLNLPTKITFQLPMTGEYIEYTYDVTGVKLEKAIQYSNTLGQSRPQYDGSFIYEYTGAANPELKFFSHAEGYVEPDDNSYAYVYQYKDHLGNIRLSYKDNNNNNNNGYVSSSEIMEENNYYPFGLQHKGYNNVINGTDHKYGFGGKEEQDELGLDWLDFHARNYDASLGRWMNIDPLAEITYSQSTYHYAYNNPIFFVDPDGLTGQTYEGYFDDGAGNIVYSSPH